MSNRLDTVLKKRREEYQKLEDSWCNFVADYIASQKLTKSELSFSIKPNCREDWMMVVFIPSNTDDTSEANFFTTLSFESLCDILIQKGAKIEVVDSVCTVKFSFS